MFAERIGRALFSLFLERHRIWIEIIRCQRSGWSDGRNLLRKARNGRTDKHRSQTSWTMLTEHPQWGFLTLKHSAPQWGPVAVELLAFEKWKRDAAHSTNFMWQAHGSIDSINLILQRPPESLLTLNSVEIHAVHWKQSRQVSAAHRSLVVTGGHWGIMGSKFASEFPHRQISRRR